MPKQSILEKDTETLTVYTNEYYCDNRTPRVYEPTKEGIAKMCEDLGVTYKTLKEEISRKTKWKMKEVWKMFIDEDKEPVRLV